MQVPARSPRAPRNRAALHRAKRDYARLLKLSHERAAAPKVQLMNENETPQRKRGPAQERPTASSLSDKMGQRSLGGGRYVRVGHLRSRHPSTTPGRLMSRRSISHCHRPIERPASQQAP